MKIMKGEIKLGALDQNHNTVGGLGIITTPLLSQKKTIAKENKRERKSLKQKLLGTSSGFRTS
jgi:hypothetical protein